MTLRGIAVSAALADNPSVMEKAHEAVGKVVEKAGEMFEETGAVGKQFTPEGAAGEEGRGTAVTASFRKLNMPRNEAPASSGRCCRRRAIPPSARQLPWLERCNPGLW